MSLRLSLHVIVHTLLFYNIPRIILCVESNDPYRVQITLALTRSIIYYIQREIVESWARKNDVIMHSFVVSFIILDLLLFSLRPKDDRQTRVQEATSTLRVCVQADYGVNSLYLHWFTVIRTSTRGMEGMRDALVEVRQNITRIIDVYCFTEQRSSYLNLKCHRGK